MNFGIKKVLVVSAVAVAALALAVPARAQFAGEQTTMVLCPPTAMINLTSGNLTNVWMDTRGYDGIATINISCCSNVPGGSITFTLEGSNDGINQIAGPSYSVGTYGTVIGTNYYYGTNGVYTTNKYILHGAVTTPTAATAGFAMPYFNTAINPFTNTGALTVSGGVSAGAYQIQYNVADAPRWIRSIWIPSGSTTNSGVTAVLRARKSNFPYN